MKKLISAMLATCATSAAHAAPLALEGNFHFKSGDVPGLCPQILVVKAELDPETEQPKMLEVWDARKLQEQGAPEITFANLVTWTAGEDNPGTYDKTVASITDSYAENYQATCVDGNCRGLGYTWIKLAHTYGGDQIEYYNRMHCKFVREKGNQ